MTDHDGYCPCPVLRAAAEIDRLTGFGMVLDGYDPARQLIVAALREKHGCRGPRSWGCPWESVARGLGLRDDRDVPEVRRRPGNNGPGVYL